MKICLLAIYIHLYIMYVLEFSYFSLFISFRFLIHSRMDISIHVYSSALSTMMMMMMMMATTFNKWWHFLAKPSPISCRMNFFFFFFLVLYQISWMILFIFLQVFFSSFLTYLLFFFLWWRWIDIVKCMVDGYKLIYYPDEKSFYHIDILSIIGIYIQMCVWEWILSNIYTHNTHNNDLMMMMMMCKKMNVFSFFFYFSNISHFQFFFSFWCVLFDTCFFFSHMS